MSVENLEETKKKNPADRFLKNLVSKEVLEKEDLTPPEPEEIKDPEPVLPSYFEKRGSHSDFMDQNLNPDLKNKPEDEPEGTKPEDEKPSDTEKPEDKKPEETTEPKPDQDKVKVDKPKAELEYKEPEIKDPDPVTEPEPDKTLSELAGFELSEDEEDYLALAKYADEKGGKSGVFKKEIDRIGKLNDFIKNWQEENPEEELTPNHPDLLEFQKKNPPALSKSEQRKIDKAIMKEEILAESKGSDNSGNDDIKREVAEMKAKPAIEEKKSEISSNIVNSVGNHEFEDGFNDEISKEIASAIKEGKTLDDIAADYPFHGELVKDYVLSSTGLVDSYLRVAKGVDEFDSKNETHAYLNDLIHKSGEWFAQNGGDRRFKEGKQFLPRGKFIKLSQTDKDAGKKYWTFDDNNIVDIIENKTKAELNADLRSMTEKIQKTKGHATATKPIDKNDKPSGTAGDVAANTKPKNTSPRVTASPTPSGNESTGTKKKPFWERTLMTS